MKSLTFNNIRKPWLYLLQGRYKPPFAPVQRDLIYVPGMDGAYLGNTSLRPLYINQPVGFVVKNDEHALQLKDELAEWLFTNEPVELQFDDEPGRTYYAIVQNTIEDFERFVNLRQGTIQFLCLDPYSYGEEQTIEFQSDSVIIENKGTAETEPIFELEVKQPTTFAMVSNGDEYMMVGRPYDVDEQPFEKYERVFYTNADSLVGWTTASNSDIDGGIVAGNIVARNGRFVADSYGSGSGWHGPAIKRSLPEPLQDFRMKAFLGFFNSTPSQVGRIEIYLLDVLGNAVCKVALKDTSNGRANTVAEFRAGDLADGHYIIAEHGDREGAWNNFSGQVHIEREGNEWYAYIAKVDTSTGRHHTRRIRRWTDVEGKYNRQVAQVVIHIGAFGNHTKLGANSGLSSMFIDKINHEAEGVPYIAEAGDVIEFDHKTGDVYINGESVPFDFGADFFTLKKGFNSLVVLPENTFDTKIKFREKFR